jgi:hypothetical protein
LIKGKPVGDFIMRTRSTWLGNRAETPRQAATQRQADIYKMNQEHPDAGPIDYENGDPDSWAESWHGYGDVEEEYEGGHVKRNELNFAEFRDDTWKHKDSDNWHSGKGTYDNVKDGEGHFPPNTSGKSTGEKAGRTYEAAGGAAKPAVASDNERRAHAERKAKAVERIVRSMLRTSNDNLITDVAVGLMGMPDRTVVAVLKALDLVSPDALDKENKLRRSLACTKLAARIVGENVPDKVLETLASTLMTLDDPTLKSILKQVAAAARVAQEQEEQEEEQQGHTGQQQQQQGQQQQEGQQQQGQQGFRSQQQQQGQQEQQGQQGQQQMMGQQEQEQQGQQQQEGGFLSQQRFMQQQGQQEQQGQQQMMGQQEQEEEQHHMGADLPAAELQMLDQMLKEELGPQGAAGGDDLSALFQAAPQAAPTMPGVASASPEIDFDDEDEMEAPVTGIAASQVASTGDAELDNLFGDNEEVQAQRQIKAAEMEQQQRELGQFAPAMGRTASVKGAKKIGQVQRGKPATVDQALENLWDRP